MSEHVLEAVFSKFLNSSLVDQRVEFLWHAGEPLTVGVEYFSRALDLCNKHRTKQIDVKHTIQSNGTLINERWCHFLVDNDFSVGISLDGPRFIHDAARRSWGDRGSFDSALAGYTSLRDAGIDSGILSVLTAESLKHPDAMYDFYRDLQVQWVAFNIEEVEGANLAASTRTNEASDVEHMYRSFISVFFRRWIADGRPFRVREFDDFLLLVRPLLLGEEKFRRPDETIPLTIVTVQKNGDISTFSPEFAGAKAPHLGNFIIGNILTDEVSDLLESRCLREIQAEVEKGIRRCAKTCKWFSLCGGGYVSNKFFENGTIDSTETTACRLHRQALSSVLIQELSSLSGEAMPNSSFQRTAFSGR